MRALLLLLPFAGLTGCELLFPPAVVDEDGDGYPSDEDCNDRAATIHPGAVEKCEDGLLDEDCDGLIDDADDERDGTRPGYFDADDDGYGDDDSLVEVCELPAHYVEEGDDCDDNDPRINPDAQEICDPLDVDEDCDGDSDDDDDSVDVETYVSWYEDADGDGWGDDEVGPSCDGGAGESADLGDCNDNNADINPEAAEVWYDGVDQDCDGRSDDDQDKDGYDDKAHGGNDCDDASANAHPGATETWYDGIDANCDGKSDYDQDKDGYDAEAYGGGDCDDTDSAYHPGATESGSVDYDCSGSGEPTPQADADYVRSSSLKTCSLITLDGSGSSDPRDSALSFEWELLDLPSGATETSDDIVSPTDEMPTFTARTAGDYTFGLVVTNMSDVASAMDQLTLTLAERTTNTAPVSNAGTDQTKSETAACNSADYVSACELCASQTFVLDASGSTDADTEPLEHAWAITSGTATLSDTTGETVTLTVGPVEPSSGSTTTSTIVVTLTTTDCYGDTDTDTITLTATCTGS